MHTIQTFVLRLLVDTEHPQAMCGTLQAMHAKEAPSSFRNETDLIALVKRLSTEQLAITPYIEGKTEKGR